MVWPEVVGPDVVVSIVSVVPVSGGIVVGSLSIDCTVVISISSSKGSGCL